MTTTAIVVLVLSALLIWGGLVASVLMLRRDGRLVEELEARERGEDQGPYRGPHGAV
ncbi:MAG: methionine/alanine import family NSS transporter small subunit [Actinotalea sp.]|nr:methionine/alanine import family NSS transporter small subunit [Actinotalea sp.]